MKKKRDKIFISIILLALIIIAAGLIYSYIAGKTGARLIAQHGNMVSLKLQMLAYEEKHGNMPDSIEALKLPPWFCDSIRIQNIKYPDDKYMFLEKEPKKYGYEEGRFFVYKDGFIKFVPTGEHPLERKQGMIR